MRRRALLMGGRGVRDRLSAYFNFNDNVENKINGVNLVLNNAAYSDFLIYADAPPFGKSVKSISTGRGSWLSPNNVDSAFYLNDGIADIPFTIFFRFRYNNNPGSYGGFVMGRFFYGTADASTRPEWYILLDQTTKQLKFYRASELDQYTNKIDFCSISMVQDQWYNVAITSDGVNIDWYIDDVLSNGAKIENGTYIKMQSHTGAKFSVLQSGYVTPPNTSNFFGELSELFLWHRKIPRQLIADLNNSTTEFII